MPVLADFMGSWPFEVVSERLERPPVISIQLCAGHIYQISAPWLSRPLRKHDLTEFLCNFAVDLVMAYLAANPELVGLHAAAVQCADGLAVFPNQNRAGKSLLTASFMAGGYVAYGDDLIALTPEGLTRSFGLPPRLRLPLPPLTAPVETFIRNNLVFSNQRYGFLKPEGSCRALFEQEAKVGSVVFLERQDRGAPELSQIDRETGLKNMVNRCLLLHREQALTAFNLCEKITQSASLWRLVYSHAHEAVEVLARELCLPFSRGDASRKSNSRLDLFELNSACTVSALSGKDLKRLYIRNKGVVCRKENNGLFLVEQNAGAIFHLNDMGRLIWDFLAEPISALEIAELLSSVFNAPKEVILSDTAKLLEVLQAEDLILFAE